MTILHRLPTKNSENSLDLLWRSEIIQIDGHGWSRYNNSNEFSKRYISLPSTDPTTIQTGLLLIDLSDDSREACDKLPYLPSPSFLFFFVCFFPPLEVSCGLLESRENGTSLKEALRVGKNSGWSSPRRCTDTMSTNVQRSVTETGLNKHAVDAKAKLLFRQWSEF